VVGCRQAVYRFYAVSVATLARVRSAPAASLRAVALKPAPEGRRKTSLHARQRCIAFICATRCCGATPLCRKGACVRQYAERAPKAKTAFYRGGGERAKAAVEWMTAAAGRMHARRWHVESATSPSAAVSGVRRATSRPPSGADAHYVTPLHTARQQQTFTTCSRARVLPTQRCPEEDTN